MSICLIGPWKWSRRRVGGGLIRLTRSLFLFAVILVPVTIDTLIWIFIIIVSAAHMLAGALYEAHLDYRIVQYLDKLEIDSKDGEMSEEMLATLRELLVTVVSGNLRIDDRKPQVNIPDSLTLRPSDEMRSEDEDRAVARMKSRSRLLNLLGA